MHHVESYVQHKLHLLYWTFWVCKHTPQTVTGSQPNVGGHLVVDIFHCIQELKYMHAFI